MPTNPDYGQSDGKRVQFSDHGQKVVVTNWEDLNLEAIDFSSLAVPAALAARPTNLTQIYFVYQASTGIYYAVNWLTGVEIPTSSIDAGIVINAVHALLPSSTTATVASGGRIIVLPGSYNVATTIVLTKYGTVLEGQSMVQVATLKQNGSLGSGRAVVEIGTNADTAAARVQHITVRNMHIIGLQDAGLARGLTCYGAACVLEGLVVQETSGEGIVISGSTNFLAYQNKAIRCSVVNYGYGDPTGLSIDGFVLTNTASDSTLEAIETYQGSQAPARGRSGLRLSGAGGLMAFNCHTWFNQKDGCLIDSNGDGTLFGCQFESNGGDGIYMTAADVAIIACNFYANGVNDTEGSSIHRSIEMFGALRNRVVGSRFSKIGKDNPNIDRHIYINNNSNDNLIEGCQFNDATNEQIVIIDSNRNVITGDIFGLHKVYAAGAHQAVDPVHGIGIYGNSSSNKINNNSLNMSGAGVPAIYEDAGGAGTLNEFKDNNIISGTITRRPVPGPSFAITPAISPRRTASAIFSTAQPPLLSRMD